MYINLVSLFQIGMKQYLEYKPINSIKKKESERTLKISDCNSMSLFRVNYFQKITNFKSKE